MAKYHILNQESQNFGEGTFFTFLNRPSPCLKFPIILFQLLRDVLSEQNFIHLPEIHSGCNQIAISNCDPLVVLKMQFHVQMALSP